MAPRAAAALAGVGGGGKGDVGRYWENKKVSAGQAWLTGLVAVGLAAGLSYWGAQHFLLGQTGWAAFWCGAMLGLAVCTATVSATAVATAAATIVVAVVAAAIAAIAGVAAVASASASVRHEYRCTCVCACGRAYELQNSSTFFLPLMLPAFIFALFVRTAFIRLWATLRYWRLGLTAFPHNWRETVCVVDASHLPELLPGAGEINPVFGLQGLLEQRLRACLTTRFSNFC